MVNALKTLAVAAVTLGTAVTAASTPAQAAIGFPRYAGYYGYYYGPGYAAGAVVGNAIAAGSYPYYGDPNSTAPHGTAPYEFPYPGYGYYYGY